MKLKRKNNDEETSKKKIKLNVDNEIDNVKSIKNEVMTLKDNPETYENEEYKLLTPSINYNNESENEIDNDDMSEISSHDSANELFSDDSDVSEESMPEDNENEKIENGLLLNRITQQTNIRKTSDIGTIESVELWNFMCHDRLIINFCPRINFVVGHNGSGKSAILTGITVCLGGKANITQRSSNLKGLIKEGKNNSSVTIKIRNCGPDAYKPEIYGNYIIVERRINREGNNGYKIKNSQGKIIANNRKELNHILDHMCIQVDNPMNILNQDLSRQFISSSTPEEKYNFFLKGTQLSQLNEDLELVRERIEKIDRIIKFKNEVLPEMKENIRNLKNECKDMMTIQNLEKKATEIKQQLTWSEVEEEENALKNEEEILKKGKSMTAILTNKINEVQNSIIPLQQKVEKLSVDIKTLNEQTQPINDRKNDIEHNLKILQKKYKEYGQEEQKMCTTMEQLKSQQKEFQKRINDEKKRIENFNKNEKDRQEYEVEKINKKISDLISKTKEIEKDLEENNKKIISNKQSENDFKNQYQSLVNEINSLNSSIRQLNLQKFNRVKAFHENYPEILNIIDEYEKEGRWQGRKPIGPFGLYIKLKDERWSKVIETLLKNFLSAMGVYNHNDRKLMQSILNKYNCSAPVFLCRNSKLDYSSGEPDEHYLTLLRAIECNSDTVIQQLVVNARIEQILLIEDRRQADKIMSSGPNGRFPRNVAACYTMEGFQVGNNGGGYATISVNLYNGPPRLLVDVEEVIKENMRRIDELKAIQNKKKGEINECITKNSVLLIKKKKTKERLEEIQKAINYSQSQKVQIQEEMEEFTPADISVMEKHLQSVTSQIELLHGQHVELMSQMKKINEEKELLDENQNQIKEKLTRIQEKMEYIRSQLMGPWSKEMAELEKCLTHYQTKLEEQQTINKNNEKQIEEMKANLEENMELALKFCPRMKITKSKSKLENELKAINLQQTQKKFDHVIFNEMIERYKEMNVEYSKAKLEIENYNTFVKKLKEGVRIRMKRWYSFRTFISMRAKNIFSELLLRRGYSGSLTFSHSNRQLILKVQIEDQALVNALGNQTYEKDPKSLSGGEKSFSTICLLLSLWETMGCPIRCLDEFDVFMDAVNRRISMKMLIESAKDTAQTQYIMITPQDMSNIQEFNLEDIRIIRMDDPERQTQSR